jgi:hypothetical protein
MENGGKKKSEETFLVNLAVEYSTLTRLRRIIIMMIII